MKAFEDENPVRICDIGGLVQMSEFFFPVHNSFYQSYVSVTLQDRSQKKQKRIFLLVDHGPTLTTWVDMQNLTKTRG